MKQITLEEACDILEQSSAVIIDGVVTYASLYDMEEQGDDDNQFLELSWVDEEFMKFELFFKEGNNRQPFIDGCDLILYDVGGFICKITILQTKKLE